MTAELEDQFLGPLPMGWGHSRGLRPMVLSPAAHPGTCSSAPLQGPCPPVPTRHRPSFQIAHPRVNPLRVEVRREYPKPRQGKPEAAGEEMGRLGGRRGWL